jgi:hypothetical protein
VTKDVGERFLHDAKQCGLQVQVETAKIGRLYINRSVDPLRFVNPSTYDISAEARPASSSGGGWRR